MRSLLSSATKMEQSNNNDALFKCIEKEHYTAEQKSYRLASLAEKLPLHRLLREPIDLQELDLGNGYPLTLWRDNGTILCVGSYAHQEYHERCVTFFLNKIGRHAVNCAIYGKTDAAIAETATWFWSLKHPEITGALLRIDHYCKSDYVERPYGPKFNFASLRAEQLAQVLDSNPTRCLCLSTSVITAEQGHVLGSRSYPVIMILMEARDGLGFSDGGASFVDALEENQQSPFGMLDFRCPTDKMPMIRLNLHRLLTLENKIKTLKLPVLEEELHFLPLMAHVNCLDYKIHAKDMKPEDFSSLEITTENLNLEINFDYVERRVAGTLVVAFLNRLAGLGHFLRLDFSFSNYWNRLQEGDEPLVVQALIHMINKNTKLIYLDLRAFLFLFDKAPNLETVFQALEVHSGLREIVLHDYPPDYNTYSGNDDSSHESLPPDYSLLERLLSRNRKIEICDHQGNIFTNGSSIDVLYALNKFYNGSAKLTKEKSELRSLLVLKALTGSGSRNFQNTALLLSNHPDVLFESIQGVNWEDFVASEPELDDGLTDSASHSQGTVRSKRERTTLSPFVGKKAARKV
ncbi:hypothetical protein FisN_10Hu408 [Fistulifera solaris]|uniref:Uncharacterized protein n=1 Tax=Fistulifera solaris TaxID=1519565 RepID=A0A1Z5JQU0_FISSO|nr:hypothetical protein FisN_10Hu408 [Fistulifera solaris]|eukprot:GAX16377.1 hypothetical protein FisN_10Hu408 [Fistulifera solaris]